ncbi:hypothetical protein VF21_04630 [Pseudogymnoascus sp. 05NY08]|nr:hypothetical protein VF21_04630 [Pseudogymnoascus sp. 05NY08]
MGGMGNQDGGDEDFSLKDKKLWKKRRKEAKEKKRFMGAGGGMAKSLCATESSRDQRRINSAGGVGE